MPSWKAFFSKPPTFCAQPRLRNNNNNNNKNKNNSTQLPVCEIILRLKA